MAALGDVLAATQSRETGVRQQAEQWVNGRFDEPGFAMELLEYAMEAAAGPEHLRQLAGLLLRQMLEPPRTLWICGMTVEQRTVLRTRLFAAFDVTPTKPRNALLLVLAKLAGTMGSSVEGGSSGGGTTGAGWEELIRTVLGALAPQWSDGGASVQGPVAGDAAATIDERRRSALKFLSLLAEEAPASCIADVMQHCGEVVLGLAAGQGDATAASWKTRARAAHFFRVSLKQLGNARLALSASMDQEDGTGRNRSQMTMEMVHNLTPLWIDLTQNVVQDLLQGNMPSVSLPMEVLATINILVADFTDIIAPQLHRVIDCIWTLLTQLSEAFVAQDPTLGSLTEYASDGECVDIELLVTQIFNIFSSAVGSCNPTMRKVLEPGLNNLVNLITGYMVLSEERLLQWSEDPNAFVAVEDDESDAYDLRRTAEQFITELCETTTKPYARVLQAVQARLASDISGTDVTEHGHGTGPGHDNKRVLLLEAGMWTCGCVGRTLGREVRRRARRKRRRLLDRLEQSGLADDPEHLNALPSIRDLAVQSAGPLGADIEGLVLPLLHAFRVHTEESGHPLLQGRYLLLVAAYSVFLDAAAADELVEQGVACAEDAQQPVATRLFAARAIGLVLASASDACVQQHHGEMIAALASVVPSTTDLTAHYAVESITATLRRVQEDATALTPELTRAVLELGAAVWTNYSTDHFCVEIAKEMLEALLSALRPAEAGAPGPRMWVEFLVPNIVQAVTEATSLGYTSTFCETVLQLLRTPVQLCEPRLFMDLFPQVISPLTEFASTTDNYTTIGEIGRVVNTALSRLPAILAAADSPEFQETVTQCCGSILKMLVHVLGISAPAPSSSSPSATGPVIPDAAAGFVAALFTRFIDACGPILGEETVQAACQFCLQRLAVVQFPSVAEQFILGFAHLIARHATAILPILSRIQVTEQQNALARLMDMWPEVHEKQVSAYCAKISTLGMLQLCQWLVASGDDTQQEFAKRVFHTALRSAHGLVGDQADVITPDYDEMDDDDMDGEEGDGFGGFYDDDEEDGDGLDDGDGLGNEDDDDVDAFGGSGGGDGGGGGGGDGLFVPAGDSESPFVSADAFGAEDGDDFTGGLASGMATAGMWSSDMVDVQGRGGFGMMSVAEVLYVDKPSTDVLAPIPMPQLLGELVQQVPAVWLQSLPEQDQAALSELTQLAAEQHP